MSNYVLMKGAARNNRIANIVEQEENTIQSKYNDTKAEFKSQCSTMGPLPDT